MSYQVFALKWRPKNFDEVVGQDQVIATVKNAIRKNRVAHAYLFSGPRGVGKTSCARIFARALNCSKGPVEEPCGECAVCRDIAAGRSLDVIEIDGASNRGIDEIRTLRENVKFSPVGGKYKVYIIDEVHQITPDGFNALLKTLEEPPDFVKFVFATTQPQKVPATILSRCQRLDFRRISVLEIISQLEKIASAEKIEVDRDALFAIAKASDGALRDAESIFDQLVSAVQGRVTLEETTLSLGMVEQETLFDITDSVVRGDSAGSLKLLNDIIDKGKDPAVILNELITHYRNLLVARTAPSDQQLLDLPPEVCDRLVRQASSIALEDILSAFAVLVNAQEMAKRLDSLRIPLEIALVKLSRPTRKTFTVPVQSSRDSVRTVKETPAVKETTAGRETAGRSPVERKEHETASARPAHKAHSREKVTPPQASAETSVETAVADPSAPPVSLQELKEHWNQIIEGVSKVKMSLASYLGEAMLQEVSDRTLTLAFGKNHSLHKETVEGKDNKTLIEKKISETVKANVKLRFVLSDKEKETVSDHPPVVRSVIDMFNGRLIKES